MKNGNKVRLSDPIFKLPPDLRSLNNPYDLRNTKETRLLKFLRTDGNTYPVIFKNGKTETEVRWNNYLEADAMTELHVSGDAVHISKRFHMDHQVVPPIAAGPFVFDLMNHAFGVIRGLEGWRLWEDLRSACYYGNEGMRLPFRDREDGFSFSLSITDFQRIKLFIPAESEKLFLQSTLFLIDGEKAKPELSSTPSYLLGIKRIGTP